MTTQLPVAARPQRAGQQPTPPAHLVLGVLDHAVPSQAVHDVQQTWSLTRAQAIAAIQAATRHHPDHPVARKWARLLQVAGRRLSPRTPSGTPPTPGTSRTPST